MCIRDRYLLGANYCIRRLNKDERLYAAEALKIYKLGLEDGAFMPDGILPHITFSNIVRMCIAVGELDFAEEFLDKYQSHLAPDRREPIYVFNLARVNYRRGNFEDALPLLMREVYKDLLLSLMVKTLTAKIFFESGESDLLIAHLEAMQQFIRRKKVMGYHRENFLNFATSLKKIVEIAGFDKTSIAKLKEDIENLSVVAERKWLLQIFDV